MWTGSRLPLLENKKNKEKEKSTIFAMTMDMETALLAGDKAQWLVQEHLTNASNVKQKIDSVNSTLVVLYLMAETSPYQRIAYTYSHLWPPFVWNHSRTKLKCDIWHFGVLLLECFTQQTF